MVSKDWHVRAKIGKYGANLLSGKTPLSKDSISGSCGKDEIFDGKLNLK